MTTVQTRPDTLELSAQDVRHAITQFASSPIFLDNEEWLNDDNPYRRQLRPQVLPYLDFDRVLKREALFDYENLAAQRLLTTIYETDLIFLPKRGLVEGRWEDFQSFYSPATRHWGEVARHALERFSFGFLEDEVEISGHWTRDSLEAYLRELTERDLTQPGVAEAAISTSEDRERAARMWLVQFAPDFLSEASPMIRNAMGAYGPAQSEFFKIIIDEYGYGVHDAKHSRLYEQTLESVGMRSDIHHYWQFYLTGSLMMSNYFHLLGKNHEYFFRYLGALYYTETSLVGFCQRAADLLGGIFGDEIDLTYFTEHVHIDQHHGSMALEKLILPVVDACGDEVIPEIVRGYEEFQVIAEIADDDFARQIAWMDRGPVNKALHAPVWDAIVSGRVTAPIARIVEPRGELSNTHCHNGDELCHIVSGTMRFVSGHDSSQILEAGEGTVIESNRLHGAVIESEECVYEIHSVGDHRACLS